jgi:hypothetical protein
MIVSWKGEYKKCPAFLGFNSGLLQYYHYAGGDLLQYERIPFREIIIPATGHIFPGHGRIIFPSGQHRHQKVRLKRWICDKKISLIIPVPAMLRRGSESGDPPKISLKGKIPICRWLLFGLILPDTLPHCNFSYKNNL